MTARFKAKGQQMVVSSVVLRNIKDFALGTLVPATSG